MHLPRLLPPRIPLQIVSFQEADKPNHFGTSFRNARLQLGFKPHSRTAAHKLPEAPFCIHLSCYHEDQHCHRRARRFSPDHCRRPPAAAVRHRQGDLLRQWQLFGRWTGLLHRRACYRMWQLRELGAFDSTLSYTYKPYVMAHIIQNIADSPVRVWPLGIPYSVAEGPIVHFSKPKIVVRKQMIPSMPLAVSAWSALVSVLAACASVAAHCEG